MATSCHVGTPRLFARHIDGVTRAATRFDEPMRLHEQR
jgi:hypothetical protein